MRVQQAGYMLVVAVEMSLGLGEVTPKQGRRSHSNHSPSLLKSRADLCAREGGRQWVHADGHFLLCVIYIHLCRFTQR